MTAVRGMGKEGVPAEFDLQELDRIVEATVAAIERSREQIFLISESARTEYEHVQRELTEVREEVARLIREVDSLEVKERAARNRLAHVSKHFDRYGERDIRQAYDRAAELQVRLQVTREQERQLRHRRDDLDRRLRNLAVTVQRAEELVTQVGVILDFLTGRLENLSRHFDSLRQKQELGISIIKVQEEERRRVAREIHDGPAQVLANVAMRLELVASLAGEDRQVLQRELAELKELVRQSLKDVRKIIFDLRPMALDDLGLFPALRAYLKGFEEKTGIKVQASLHGPEGDGPEGRLESAMEITLFRLIQEATSNVEKHARARNLLVRVEWFPTEVRVLVQDDGQGFVLEEVLGERNRTRFGLVSMRERVDLVGGRFRITTAPGQGTSVEIALPLGQREVGAGGAAHQGAPG